VSAINPVRTGATIVSVDQRRPDLRFPFPEDFAARIVGTRITAVGRRAKYLVVTLANDLALVMHLGMSGRFSIGASPSQTPQSFGDYIYDTGADAKHDHVVITLSTGATIVYNDPRRFGFMLLIPQVDLDAHPLFAGLGIEPLGNGLSADYIAAKAHGRRVDLKAFLLDQRTIAGLGNIYVSEALHGAGLSPRRQASSLAKANGTPTDRAHRLVPEIRSVLAAAIEAGGSSLRNYRHADGTTGGFQNAFAVYGRGGQPCLRPGCSGHITRTVQSQRATFSCGVCQK
jgi:formamidopyrimidine-DNA glycosylase